MAHLPRGIDPNLLISQVRNTMPYLFEEGIAGTSLERFPPTQNVLKHPSPINETLNHLEYFKLCVSCHLLTCATPVPTDVDNQIRNKLWPEQLPLETALQMAQFVLESRKWDFTQVSSRFTTGAAKSPWENEVLDGHLGEWFTLAAAAYCALKRYPDPQTKEKCNELFENIGDEVRRHSEIFGSLWRGGEGLICLKTAATIAHNFGDLDRVMDIWELSVGDPLRLEFYKLSASPFDTHRKLRYLGRLWVAGELYKFIIDGSSMALENHRHFALRKPRCLRQSRDFLIPIGPFFDDWGRQVARGLANPDGSPSEETYEVIGALRLGWERLAKTVGYGRALRGFQEVHTGLQISPVPQVLQTEFEKRWNDEAIRAMDEIPSKA